MGITGLDFQTVDVKFTQGLDTKSQRKLVVPAKWNTLSNVSLAADGTPQRRDGCTALVASANGNGLATYNNELLLVNGSTVSSISTGATDFANPVAGKLGYVGVSKTEVRRSTGMQDSLDCATGGGFTCYVWRDLTGAAVQVGLNFSLVDETTGTQVQANVNLTTTAGAFCPRVVFAGSAFFIFWDEAGGAGQLLQCRVIQTSTPTVLGAATSLINSASFTALNFDACAFGTNSAMVSYPWNDGVTSVRTIQVTQTAGVPAIAAGPTNLQTQVALPIASLCAIGCATFSASLAVTLTYTFGATASAGQAGATINTSWVVQSVAQYNPTPPAVNNPCHITGTAVGGLLQTFADDQSSWGTNAATAIYTSLLNTNLTTNAGPSILIRSASFAAAATDPAGPKGPWIAGKAFTSGSNTFLPMCVMENYQGAAFTAPAGTRVTNNMQNTLFVLDCTGAATIGGTIPAAVVAKALYGAYGVATVNNNAPRVSTPCSVVALTSGFAMACTERTLLSFVGGFNLSPTGVVRLTLTPNLTLAPIRAQLGESTYVAGGSLTAYDGAALAEAGFPLFPEGISVEVVNAAGTMTDGVHQVVVVYEWVDNAGQRCQSAPSLAVSGTCAGGNDALRVKVPTLLLSQKAGVKMVAYVTQANGLTFNRVGTVGAGSAGSDNVTTAAFVQLADITQPDAEYAGNELLYNQPNQAGTTLVNNAPGPCTVIGSHQNRLWGDKADQPGAWWCSQQYVNNLGLQFNEQLGGMVDAGAAGNFTGFCPLDEKQVIFCQRKIYVVHGAGPTASGGFSNYSEAQEIPSDVGCSEPRSILKMPQGIMFKSPKGWYLLGRDLQTRYIGAGVAIYDIASVASAVLMGDRQECRFSGGSSNATQLIYSYGEVDQDGIGQWSTAQYAQGDYIPADAVYWVTAGCYVHLSDHSGLNQDTPGVFLDSPGAISAMAIPVSMRTAFLHVGVLAGYQRVRRLFLTGTSPTAPTSSLVITVDYDDAYGAVTPGAYSFTTAMATAFPTFNNQAVDLRTTLRRQKCKSIAFTFRDTPTTANPAGVNFQALSLEVGLKRGLSKLSALQSAG